MAIAASDSVSLLENGTSDWVAVRTGENVIAVTSPTWGGSTEAALQMSYDATEGTAGAVEDDDAEGSDLVFTDNRYRKIIGPGFVRIVVTNISGAVTLKRVSPA